MIRSDRSKDVYRFDIADLCAGMIAGKEFRAKGFRTRLVYRGPRPLVRCWRSGKMITPGYTVKKNAVAVDLYVYKK